MNRKISQLRPLTKFGVALLLLTVLLGLSYVIVRSLSPQTAGGSGAQRLKEKPVTGVRSIAVNGVERRFILYVPDSYSPGSDTPLVLDFHGIGSNAAGQKGLSGYQAVAEDRGFLVAYPEGLDNAWNIGPCCTLDREVDDVAFARAIVDAVATEAAIDRQRIYATGFSMGGGMTYHLACHAADMFAAVVPNAFDLLEENVTTCAPSRPIPILITRGTKDYIVPYTGGASKPPNALDTTIHFLGAQRTAAFWIDANGCSQTTTQRLHGCSIHSQCREDVQVGLCTIEGGEHTPGNARMGWEFLSQYRLRK